MSPKAYFNTPLYLLAFLSGVALRSFFNVPDYLVLGLLGFVLASSVSLALNPLFGGSDARTRSEKGSPRPEDSQPEGRTERDRRESSGFFQQEKTRVLMVAWLSGFFLLGILRFSYFENNLVKDKLHLYYGEAKTLQGVVLSFESKNLSSRTILETDLGKIMVVGKPYPKFRYGDIVEIRGGVEEPQPFNDFDIKSYLAKDMVYSQMIFPEVRKIGYAPDSRTIEILFAAKEKFRSNLKKVLPEPHASLADGMLLGSEGMLPEKLSEAFKKTGTIHILVLSGYNITVIGAVILGFFGFFLPQTFAWIFAVLGIIFFTLMSGAEPAAVRASIMAIIGLIAFGEGRRKTAIIALLWAALLMILWNPMLLRFDRGFQLSFMATLGLILVAEKLKKLLWFLPEFLSIRESASSSLAAQIFVLPLLFSWGNIVSVASPLVNVLVVGAVPAIMLFSFLGALTTFISYYAGSLLASVGYLLITYQIFIVELFAGLNV